MAKARRAKSTRRTSTSRTNSRSTTRTRKKKNNIDKNLVVVVMIITSLLLCVLIYAQSGWIGEHLSPVLGGIMGWIKYIIPIGTLAMAIKIAVDEGDFDTFFTKRASSLRTAVVKFARLSDDDWA